MPHPADPTDPAVIPLPVTAVTCLEDRAQLERTARLELAAGVQRLRLGPLTPLAVDHTLRAELSGPAGARVLDARLVRSWEPRPAGPQQDDSPLRARLHELRAARRAAEAERQRAAARLALAEQLTGELLREVAEGAGLGEAEPERWAAELDRAGAEQERQAERERALRGRVAELAEQERRIDEALDLAEPQPPQLRCFLELAVAAERAGTAELTVGHLTACALWRPAYRAVLAGATVRLALDAVVWQATGEDWSGVRLTLSTARSALAAEPPALTEDRLVLRELSAGEKRTVEVELREEEISTLGPAGPVTGEELPGVDDGGEVRVLTAPDPAAVPGDGRAHRVPLGAFEAAAEVELVAAPELSPLVSEVVSVRNEWQLPLLAGPVELVRGSGFVGRGELRYTAPGAVAELGFPGSDEFRLLRGTEVVEETQGMARRSVRTTTVRVHVTRLCPPGTTGERTVVLRERIPVSEVAAVEVRLDEQACDPRPAGVDAEGVVRWELPLAPNSRRTVTLVHRLSASAKVAGL
ncbi:mucoidy inhibitor MuiA family protein [Kitasatospora sp. NPDC006697]|uniref:mucoidy inhibitor MuiA family protein n=1 Tax=Kitasatospora sp. NPDC006697 TaxID=3364020 RepID=UPI0036763138